MACEHMPTTEVPETFHFILDSLEDDLDDEKVWTKWQHLLTWPRETLLWLWRHTSSYGLDMAAIDEFCLRMTLRHLGTCSLAELHEVEKLLLQYLTPALLSRIRNHETVFLDDLFSSVGNEPLHITDSEQAGWDLGTVWLTTLSSCGIDIADYLAHEMDVHSNGMVVDYLPEDFVYTEHYNSVERQIQWTYSEQGGYSVGWRFPELYPAELVLDEFLVLVQSFDDEEWPFVRGRRNRQVLPGSWID
jgi:hypothetical protein